MQLWKLLPTWLPLWRRTRFWPTKIISSYLFSCWVQNWRRATAKLYHAPGDADLLIVQKAVQSATTSRTVLVEDSDLIILLCYYVSLDSCHLFFCPEPKKSITKLCIWNIRATREKLGQGICNNILILHIYSILEHETTSYLYEVEKNTLLVTLKQEWEGKGVPFSMHDIGDKCRESFSLWFMIILITVGLILNTAQNIMLF